MTEYEEKIREELRQWEKKILRKPSLLDRKTSALQQKINTHIPEKVHDVLTAAIRNMVKGVLFGSVHSTTKASGNFNLQETEYLVKDKIAFYKNTAAVEGSITGFGGILTGLADFPLFLSIKIKMLFEIASLYGFDVKEINERIYILNIFQLTFSSQLHRHLVFSSMQQWDQQSTLPDLKTFDWKKFQQEYRDHIDIAKLAQLLPGIGAVVGFVVNERLTKRLGTYAMNAYRMRLLQKS